MLQTFLLLLAAISVHLSLSPPNPPVKPKEYATTVKKTLFEIFVQSVTFCSKVSQRTLLESAEENNK